MDTKHTPGKWVVEPATAPGHLWISGADHKTVYDSQAADVWPMSEADKARIVHCVNNHDALLVALEAMVDMEDWSQEDIDPQSTVGRAYAAIAAAKGEA